MGVCGVNIYTSSALPFSFLLLHLVNYLLLQRSTILSWKGFGIAFCQTESFEKIVTVIKKLFSWGTFRGHS